LYFLVEFAERLAIPRRTANATVLGLA
jgi:hypothetical protein